MQENLVPAPITLPEDKKYEDLNLAHQSDVEAGGDNNASGPEEEALHSTQQAQADNSESYRNEMTNANTRGLLESLKARLKPDPESNVDEAQTKSEFDIRTGEDTDTKVSLEEKRIPKREEKFAEQDEKAESYKNTIKSQNEVREVKKWMDYAATASENGKINPDHLPDIQAEADARIKELQDKQAESYKNTIKSQNEVREVKKWMDYATTASQNERISPDHLPDIQVEADARIRELQDKQAESYKNTIRNQNGAYDVQKWKDYAATAAEAGRIRADHLAEIESIAKNRIAEINEGV